jgi:hypothetical protein
VRTHSDLLRVPEFTPLFATSSLQVAASTVSGLALGTLVYASTRSPLLAALSMFGASFAQLLGAAGLLSAADRLPPRAAISGIALIFGAGSAVLAVPGLPLPAAFAVARWWRGPASARARRARPVVRRPRRPGTPTHGCGPAPPAATSTSPSGYRTG